MTQCSYLETTVYKQYGDNRFRSAAGDVSQCQYSDGYCRLPDQSVLVWESVQQASCEYQKWFDINGTFTDGYFVSSSEDLALTFRQHPLNGWKTCNGTAASMSDQGLLVTFNVTTMDNRTLLEKVKSDIGSNNPQAGDGLGQVMAFVSTMTESLSHKISQIESKLYWTSYQYTCKNIAQTLRTISMLAEEHPTTTARYILGTANVYAKSGPGFLEVYPCNEISTVKYTFQPMPHDNCTEFIPILVSNPDGNVTGYMDPRTNVVHTKSMHVPCHPNRTTYFRLEDEIYAYENGTIKTVEPTMNLSLPGFALGAHAAKIDPVIFSSFHKLNWNIFSTHSDLNEVLSTLTRQKQLLNAMGIQINQRSTFDEDVIESRENLFRNPGSLSYLEAMLPQVLRFGHWLLISWWYS